MNKSGDRALAVKLVVVTSFLMVAGALMTSLKPEAAIRPGSDGLEKTSVVNSDDQGDGGELSVIDVTKINSPTGRAAP